MSSEASPSNDFVNCNFNIQNVIIIWINLVGCCTVKAEFLNVIYEYHASYFYPEQSLTWSFSASWTSVMPPPSSSLIRVVTTSLWSQSSPSSGLAQPGFHLFSVSFLQNYSGFMNYLSRTMPVVGWVTLDGLCLYCCLRHNSPVLVKLLNTFVLHIVNVC